MSRILHDLVFGDAPEEVPEELARYTAALEASEATSQTLLAWVLGHFAGKRVGLTSAFGPEGCVLIDLATRVSPTIPIYTIDTGFMFSETIATREAYRVRGANIQVVEPLVSIGRQARLHGEALYARDPDHCCQIRKVEPMRKILDQLDVWITAIRRDQGPTRSETPILSMIKRPDGTPVVKVCPMVRWTRKDTWGYLLHHDLPYNPLLDQGYSSIGCQPCTDLPAPGATERSGRWGGRAKTECGIHSL